MGSDETSPPAAVLTPSQREFLAGHSDLTDRGARAAKSRIRERVRVAFSHDFRLLFDRLNDTDLDQIRKTQMSMLDEDVSAQKDVTDPVVLDGFVDAMAFIYRMRPDPDLFGDLAEAGKNKAQRRLFDIDELVQVAEKKMDSDERLSDSELRLLLTHSDRDAEEIREHVAERARPPVAIEQFVGEEDE